MSISGRFQPGEAHPSAIDLQKRLRLLQGMDTGTLSLRDIRRGERSRIIVQGYCEACGVIRDLDATNILRGLTTTCRCQRRVKYNAAQRELAERYDPMMRRCTSPSDPNWPNYGGRGIQNRFASRDEWVRYLYALCPRRTYVGLDVDRIDNDGHYEPGNLRFVSRRQNVLNRRNTCFVEFEGRWIPCANLWPLLKARHRNFALSRDTTAKLARSGVSPGEILNRKPRRKRKVVIGVRARTRPSTGT